MRMIHRIPTLMVLVIGLLVSGCVEIILEPAEVVDSSLRTVPDRAFVPRPADGQSWLVTTLFFEGGGEQGPQEDNQPPVFLDQPVACSSCEPALEVSGIAGELGLSEALEHGVIGGERGLVDAEQPAFVPQTSRDSAGRGHTSPPSTKETADARWRIDRRRGTPVIAGRPESAGQGLELGERGTEQPSGLTDGIDIVSVTWEFKVLDTDLLPAQGSVFHPFALDDQGEVQPITLVEAIVLGQENATEEAKGIAPVYHLAFSRTDYRLLAVQVGGLVDGLPTSQLIDPEDYRPTSFTDLLVSSHLMLDFLLPRFPLGDEKGETTELSLDDGGVEVAFTSSLDGELIVQRWDPGQPWFTYSRGDNRISWLGSVR
ncbi:MAG: hypothetical protein JW797_00050 [Bradymonadales bacterium]|nr:hypothetical protein [Bradymonadales bacterium]